MGHGAVEKIGDRDEKNGTGEAGAIRAFSRSRSRDEEETPPIVPPKSANRIEALDIVAVSDKLAQVASSSSSLRPLSPPSAFPHHHHRFSQSAHSLENSRSAPQLSFIPATPTHMTHPGQLPATPPRKNTQSPTPTPGSALGALFGGSGTSFSNPGSPSTSSLGHSTSLHDPNYHQKDRERERKNSKPRSGSVSMLQRAATTVLEAAASGLVRKKSDGNVKEREREREREREKEKEKENASSSPLQRQKSPPPIQVESPPSEQDSSIGSPWIVPSVSASNTVRVSQSGESQKTSESPTRPTSTTSQADTLSALPQLNNQKRVRPRNRPNLLLVFKNWFGDAGSGKGKRKVSAPTHAPVLVSDSGIPVPLTPTSPLASSVKSTNNGRAMQSSLNRRGRGGSGRSNRASMSSRRSSSANSRRSSVASVQRPRMMDSPSPSNQSHNLGLARSMSDASGRSRGGGGGWNASGTAGGGAGGSHTPRSERAEFNSSRPSSVRSFSGASAAAAHLRSQSPHGSLGSAAKTASPLQRYHNRRGSNESSGTTTVRRQPRSYTHVAGQRSGSSGSLTAPMHKRTGSSTSSVHSPASSRRTSWYGAEAEGEMPSTPIRPTTPHAPLPAPPEEQTPRRPAGSIMVAHKKTTPFSGPSGSTSNLNRAGTSWKKSWGVEPPGWSSRSTHLPVEISIVSSDNGTVIRDVISGRHSNSLDDDDEWEDASEEEDEEHVFVGGVGQTQVSSRAKRGLPPAPVLRLRRDIMPSSPTPQAAKRTGRGKTMVTTVNTNLLPAPPSRQRGGTSGGSPIATNIALPEIVGPVAGSRATRGQMPPSRAPAIQEEEEEEEES